MESRPLRDLRSAPLPVNHLGARRGGGSAGAALHPHARRRRLQPGHQPAAAPRRWQRRRRHQRHQPALQRPRRSDPASHRHGRGLCRRAGHARPPLRALLVRQRERPRPHPHRLVRFAHDAGVRGDRRGDRRRRRPGRRTPRYARAARSTSRGRAASAPRRSSDRRARCASAVRRCCPTRTSTSPRMRSSTETSSGRLRVSGTLHVPPGAQLTGGVEYATLVNEAITVSAPCDCSAGFVDVAGAIARGRRDQRRRRGRPPAHGAGGRHHADEHPAPVRRVLPDRDRR